MDKIKASIMRKVRKKEKLLLAKMSNFKRCLHVNICPKCGEESLAPKFYFDWESRSMKHKYSSCRYCSFKYYI